MTIHHPNWYDRDIEVKSIKSKQVSISIEIEAEDGKMYGLTFPIDSDLVNLSDAQLHDLALNQLKTFEI